MTGFEKYLKNNGFKLTHGTVREFSTYNNCDRRWENEHGKSCLIGLFAKPTRIGITHPVVIDRDGKFFSSLPSEKDYQFYLDQILKR